VTTKGRNGPQSATAAIARSSLEGIWQKPGALQPNPAGDKLLDGDGFGVCTGVPPCDISLDDGLDVASSKEGVYYVPSKGL
jgi:hypothetical protein